MRDTGPAVRRPAPADFRRGRGYSPGRRPAPGLAGRPRPWPAARFGAAAAAQGVSHAGLLAGLAAASGIRSGQLVEPEQVASLVAYLASPLAASITGQEYLIDGGAIKTA